MSRRLLSLAALALAVAFSGCFNVDKPTCSYACSDTTPACPDDYECRTDGYCHLVGTTAECMFSDAAMAPIDMSVPSDLTPGTPSDLVSTSD
jgi:hypothetical protein